MFRSFLATCLATIAIAAPAAADPWSGAGAPSRPAWVGVKVERRLNMIDSLPGMASTLTGLANGYFGNNGPGMAVGLVLDDGLYYSQGFGFANTAKTTVPSELTVFRAGSLSKVMTATALQSLIDDPTRNMALTDSAALPKYLPELKFVCPKWNVPCVRGGQATGITLAHLVSHTAGLPNVMQQTNAGIPTWLSDLKKSWLLFSPGSLGAYSGVGMEAAGLIGSRVSGMPYPAFVKKTLFDPLGMVHSTMDPIPPEPLTAQKWQFSGNAATWSFAQFNGIIGGDDQPMILPAGGLATNVIDLSRFIQMWLSGVAPKIGNRPILKASTIAAATTSLFGLPPPAPQVLPTYCTKPAGPNPAPLIDPSGFFYSYCGNPFGFGVGWFAGQAPFIQHNGDEPGLSGSNTVVDQSHKIAATGLISTEPFPNVTPTQPPGLIGNFMGNVVSGLLASGTTASGVSDWTGHTLATGSARVLWLSGKLLAQSDLGAFTPTFQAAHNLTAATIVPFLTTWRAKYGLCTTVRVRSVDNSHQIQATFHCAKKDFDTVLNVETDGLHRIAWTDPPPPKPTPSPKCVQACNVDEGACMAKASGSDEKKQCVQEKKQCVSDCTTGG